MPTVWEALTKQHGTPHVHFEVEDLLDAVEELIAAGEIRAVEYSTPDNPTRPKRILFHPETKLRIIG